MSEEQTLYDKNFVEKEEYFFDTTAFNALRDETEYDSNSEFSEEEDEENYVYDGEDNATSKNIISEEDKVIAQINVKKTSLIPCVLIDIVDGELCCCGSTKDLWHLWQLVGMWEIDEKMVKAQKEQLEN